MDENKVINTSEEIIAYGDETIVISGFVQMDHQIKGGEISPVGTMIVTEDGKVVIEDENIVDIKISEAFPFSTHGALDADIGDKDVLIGGQSRDGLLNNDEVISLTEALETCASLGGLENTSHGTLYGTEFADQHPIEAITGLREELDEIEALGVVESNVKNQANYYLWENDNGQVGKFVTIGEDTDQIRVCAETDDVFGVTVEDAGFIGGQDDIPKDDSYGLVVTTGLAPVQCELDVETGDYVVSNDYGYAKKSNGKYGYQVTGISNINGIRYAVISLATPISRLRLMSEDWEDMDERMGVAEKNIASAVNVANEAYKMASSGGGNGSGSGSSNAYLEDKVENLESKVNGLDGEIDSIGSQISSAVSSANTAKTLANNAISSVESVRSETIDIANNALAEVNWTKEQVASVKQQIDENSSSIEGLSTFRTEATRSIAQLAQQADDNGASIQFLVNKIDKYSYGAFSQAYSFSQEEAEAILEVGQVYVPSRNHDEIYDRVERHADADYWFTKGYHYTWGKTVSGLMRWIESESPEVTFSKEYIIGGNGIFYWVAEEDIIVDDITYEADTLYIWENEMWIAVATLEGNLSSRETSILKQTTDSISLSVQDVANDMADITLRVNDNESSISSLVSWTRVDPMDEESEQYNLAAIYQTANDAGASISQIVKDIGSDGEVTVASIVTAVNNSGSNVTINADKINFVGQATFLTADDLGVNGTTSIYGGRIETNTITADQIASNSITSDKIMANSITSSKIAAQSITADKLAANAITAEYIEALNIEVNAAQIKTQLTADQINANGLNITNGTYSGTLSVGGSAMYPNFYVDDDGNVTMNGDIHLSGNIIWGEYGLIQVRYGTTATTSSWSSTFTSGYHYYAKYSYDGGYSWTSPIQIVGRDGKDGEDGQDGQDGADGSVSSSDVFNILTSGGTRFGIFSDSSSNQLYINANYIKSGTISSDLIDTKNIVARYVDVPVNGYCNIYTTIDLGNYCSISSNYTTLENLTLGGSQQDFGHSGTTGYLRGTWYSAGSNLITSDINFKHDIIAINDNYSVLFDNLKPSLYKYNDGLSGRYHTGFIAQDVEDAIRSANLTTLDFAAFARNTETDSDGNEFEKCYLRYEEFIALNTYEIQKLKVRVAELEAKLGGTT